MSRVSGWLRGHRWTVAAALVAAAPLLLVLALLRGQHATIEAQQAQIDTQRATVETLVADVARMAETNRGVSCAWLYTLVANPPPNPTPDQVVRFEFYRGLYGAGVDGTAGLECPRPLPPG